MFDKKNNPFKWVIFVCKDISSKGGHGGISD